MGGLIWKHTGRETTDFRFCYLSAKWLERPHRWNRESEPGDVPFATDPIESCYPLLLGSDGAAL